MNGRSAATQELKPSSRRLESFSDAVFAIAVTIMVFEIRIPDVLAFGNDAGAMRDFATQFATYLISFYLIANLWTSHHYLVLTVHSPARTTIWLNNLLLFCVSLIPVATRFLSHHPGAARAAAFYGLVCVACTGSFMLLRRHAARMSHNRLHRDIHRQVLQRTWLFLAIYLASIPLAFVRPWLAWTCFAIVPPMLFLPVIRARSAPDQSAAEEQSLKHSCP